MLLATLKFLDPLTLFGLVAVSMMLVFYSCETRSRFYVLAFAFACVMGSAYGFMQGAWPFGLVEGIWSIVALKRWWQDAGEGRAAGDRPVVKLDAFTEDLLTIMERTGPTTYVYKTPDGRPSGYVQLYRPMSGRVLIHRLWSVRPGNGTGSEMLRLLCELADLHAVEIALRPLPFGPEPRPLDVNGLRRWYDRFGFAGASRCMLRKPMVLEPV